MLGFDIKLPQILNTLSLTCSIYSNLINILLKRMSSNESRKNQMASAIVLLCLLITGCHQEENYDQKHQKHVLANDIQRERINRYLYQNGKTYQKKIFLNFTTCLL